MHVPGLTKYSPLAVPAHLPSREFYDSLPLSAPNQNGNVHSRNDSGTIRETSYGMSGTAGFHR
jgi:hypothetical protein